MSERISQLDGVRALAISAVFVHHAFGVKLLWVGVDIFFILSGYLITGILLKVRTKPLSTYFAQFYKRRVRRILPPYLVFLLISILFVGTAWLHQAYFYLVFMNFMKPFEVYHPESMGALWSLAVEEQFYIFWPFAVYFLSEKALVRLAGILVVLVPMARGLCTPLFSSQWAIYMLTPFRMDLLLMGGLLAIAWRHHRAKIERYGQYGLLLVLVALGSLIVMAKLGYSTSSNRALSNVWIYEFCLIGSTGVMLWALSGKWVRVLQLPPVTYLGRISYTFYLIHMTMLILCHRWFSNPLVCGLLAALLSLAYSALSWRFMEQPILGSKPQEPSVVTAS